MQRKKLFATILLATSAATFSAAHAQTLRNRGPMPSDPVMRLAADTLPPNEFVLDSNDDVELIRFKTTRDNMVCVPRINRHSIDTPRQNVGLKVSWDDQSATIQPGNCLSFDAKSVSVTPAGRLRPDDVLIGTIHTKK